MTADERKRYQLFAKQCIKRGTPVKVGNGTYKVLALIYRLSPTGEELFSAEISNGCNSLMTVSVERLYKENRNEMHSE